MSTSEITEEKRNNDASDEDVKVDQEIPEKKYTKEDFDSMLFVARKHMLLGEFPEAVEQLGTLCELVAVTCGEQSYEMARPGYVYGCALLELGRMESDILGNALEGISGDAEDDKECVPESETVDNDEEKEDMEVISEKVIDAMCGETSPEKNGAEEMETEEVAEENENEVAEEERENGEECEEEEAINNGKEQGEPENVEAEKDDVKAEGEEEEEDDDLGNLQLAWENIDMARVLYAKSVEAMTDKEGESYYQEVLSLSDCYEKLADISVEQNNPDNATKDYSECLRLRKELSKMPSSSITRIISNKRLMAECYFKMTIPLKLVNVGEAIPHHEESIHILKSVLETISKFEGDLDSEVGQKVKSNEEEIKALIPDLEGVLQDLKEEAAETGKSLDEIKATMKGIFDKLGGDQKEADDINHLVRKKASPLKPINGEIKEVEEKEPPLKKAKNSTTVSEGAVNGDAVVEVSNE